MKLLAIHSNSVFFKSDTPNVYRFLTEKRGKLSEFEELNKKYQENKEAGPLLLKEMIGLTASGIPLSEFENNCREYWEKFKDDKIAEKLKEAKEKYDLIYVFTSYPAAVYGALKENGLTDNVFGVEFSEQEGVISGIKDIEFKNEETVKEKMEEIGFGEEFTTNPNRYGLLGVLIEKITEKEITKEDITVLGKGATAVPMHKVAGKIIDNFLEI